MHYVATADLAFISVESIMRDVTNGWMIRYIHSNTASLFFAVIYIHVARGFWYGSYRAPRTLTWNIGVILLILLMGTAFMGYVLPYGQMSHWGNYVSLCPTYFYNLIPLYFIFNINNDLYFVADVQLSEESWSRWLYYIIPIYSPPTSRVLAHKRIGPHNIDILSIIWGGLLGDAYGERRTLLKNKGATRITFQQEAKHLAYGLWLHNKLSMAGYCSPRIPEIQSRLGKGGIVRKLIRFRTWSYTSFNWIHEAFYTQTISFMIKTVPIETEYYLTPLALAIWIMDDGAKVGKGLKFCTNSFSYNDCLFLSQILWNRYGLKCTVQSAGVLNQYHLYIWKESMSSLREKVGPYIIPSMKYKLLD